MSWLGLNEEQTALSPNILTDVGSKCITLFKFFDLSMDKKHNLNHNLEMLQALLGVKQNSLKLVILTNPLIHFLYLFFMGRGKVQESPTSILAGQ